MKTLKVYLKFKAENSKRVGFVTKKSDGAWSGCYETDNRPKKVVVADSGIASTIKDGVLYKATLIPMKSGSGFVAISATPVTFEARVETIVCGKKFKVLVVFGNKTIEFNPYTKDRKKRDLSDITMLLKDRDDIKDKDRVISDFNHAAMSAINYFGVSV